MTTTLTAPTGRRLLSGDEAIALAARDAGVTRGTGYPGTPSTEILEAFAALGGKAAWAPNEKVALEVAAGVAFAGGRALVTMKHVGLNVAADPLFTLTHSGVRGGLVLVSADDPGMHSSQNEQDNRWYALAAGIPMLEASDSQEAYDLTLTAFMLSERWKLPVLLRVTTRVCHSKTVLVRPGHVNSTPPAIGFTRDIQGLVMVPANARPAHRKLRQKLNDIQAWGESSGIHQVLEGEQKLGIITSGISFQHVREAAPQASVLKLALTYPLPMEQIRKFVSSVQRCVVIEEGDHYLADAIRAAGINVERKGEMYRFGELNVGRVRRILAKDISPEAAPSKGKAPQLCPACPYHAVFNAFTRLNCLVAGDIGCYTLGALPPHMAMDTCLCMGASIGVGLGMRQTLPEADARRVVSVIGDSTFMHSGLTGLADMVYNPPATGHVVVILDNGTTAMTGQQEHPGTGRTIDHEATGQVKMEAVIAAMGVRNIDILDPYRDPQGFENLLQKRLAANELTVIIARRPCVLAAGKIREYERRAELKTLKPDACEAVSGGSD